MWCTPRIEDSDRVGRVISRRRRERGLNPGTRLGRPACHSEALQIGSSAMTPFDLAKPIIEGLAKATGRRVDVAVRGSAAERTVADAMEAAVQSAVAGRMTRRGFSP